MNCVRQWAFCLIRNNVLNFEFHLNEKCTQTKEKNGFRQSRIIKYNNNFELKPMWFVNQWNRLNFALSFLINKLELIIFFSFYSSEWLSKFKDFLFSSSIVSEKRFIFVICLVWSFMYVLGHNSWMHLECWTNNFHAHSHPIFQTQKKSLVFSQKRWKK